MTLDPQSTYRCPEKESKMFSVISSIKLRRLWWNFVYRYCFLNKFAAKRCKQFPPHLNNVSTLSCETWNAHRTRATTELLQKETPEFILPQLWSPNLPDINPVDFSMWKLLQEKVYIVYQICINDLMNWNSDWERSGPSWMMLSLWQPFVSGAADSSRSVMLVLYIFSCHISDMLRRQPSSRCQENISHTNNTLAVFSQKRLLRKIVKFIERSKRISFVSNIKANLQHISDQQQYETISVGFTQCDTNHKTPYDMPRWQLKSRLKTTNLTHKKLFNKKNKQNAAQNKEKLQFYNSMQSDDYLPYFSS